MVTRGSYCLCISVNQPRAVEVGALGTITFEKGLYVYVGSALNGIDSRVRRHLRTNRGDYRAIHWHIDYLLKQEGVEVVDVYVLHTVEREECRLASELLKLGRPVRGFGCSDCRCVSHLYRVDSCEVLIELGLERYPV